MELENLGDCKEQWVFDVLDGLMYWLYAFSHNAVAFVLEFLSDKCLKAAIRIFCRHILAQNIFQYVWLSYISLWFLVPSKVKSTGLLFLHPIPMIKKYACRVCVFLLVIHYCSSHWLSVSEHHCFSNEHQAREMTALNADFESFISL